MLRLRPTLLLIPTLALLPLLFGRTAGAESSTFLPDDPAELSGSADSLAPQESPPDDSLPLGELLQPSSPWLVYQDFISPITGDSFSAQVLARTPPVGSYDLDGCPHPAINSLAYTLVIDPQSGYVAPPASFNLKPRLKAEELTRILGQPKFDHDSPSGGGPWAGAYGWEKLENAARLAQAQRSGDLVEGSYWLQAAWAVRLDVVSGGNSFDSEVEELFKDLPLQLPPDVDLVTPYELRLARSFESQQSDGSFVNLAPDSLALAMAWLLRSRGELAGARHWLREAHAANAGLDSSGVLYSFLNSSLGLEEEYLGHARDSFAQAWRRGEVTPGQQPAVAFQLGELSRRLGRLHEAALWYMEALNHGRGEVAPATVESQLELCYGRGW